LDLQNHTILKDNKTFTLAKKESAVLQYLLTNSSRSVSIDELISNIYSYEDSVEASTIRTYIKNLRKILGEEKILNIRGVGYRFNI